MNEFADKLESLTIIASFSEFPQHVKHVKEMMSSKDALLLQLLETIEDCFLLICDDYIRN